MTIKAFLDKAPALKPIGHYKSFQEALMECTDIWSNEAAQGYAVMGMEAARLDRETIREVLESMSYAMDSISTEEAVLYAKDF